MLSQSYTGVQIRLPSALTFQAAGPQRSLPPVTFAGKKDKPQPKATEQLQEAFTDALKRYYIGVKVGQVFTLGIGRKNKEKEVQRLADRLWEKAFKPIYQTPEKTQAFIDSLNQDIGTSQSPTSRQAGLLMTQALQSPDFAKRLNGLVSDLAINGGIDKFLEMRDNADFQKAQGATKLQVVWKSLGKDGQKEIYDKVWNQIVDPTLDDPQARVWLQDSLDKSFGANPMMQKVGVLLGNNLSNKAGVRHLSDFVYNLLENGGNEELKKLSRLMKSPAYTNLTDRSKGQFVLESMDPEFAKKITDGIWNEFILPVLNDTPRAEALIDSIGKQVDEKVDQPMVRTAVLGAIPAVKDHLNHDKTQLKKIYDLGWQVMRAGGYKKMENLLRTAETQKFKESDYVHQGQMLLEAMGPTFVKAFQMLSTVDGLFPPDVQESMVKLYEDITPIPFSEVNAIVEKELGKPIKEAYAYFDETPLKAASIAQVHRAGVFNPMTRQVEDVIVKVVKNGVAETIDEDFDLLMPLIDIAQRLGPHLEVKEMFENFRQDIKNECFMTREPENELDAGGEAQRLARMGDKLKAYKKITVPKVYGDLTSDRILTMSFCKGKSLKNFQGDSAIAKRYLGLMMEQIFMLGACQADPHPGNVLYDEETEKFAIIDGGLFYFIPKQERIDFSKLLISLASQDPGLICEAVVRDNGNPEAMKAFKQAMASKLPVSGKDLNEKETLKFMNEAAKQAKALGLNVIEVNPLIWKSLFTSIMVAKTLDPKVNIAMPALMRVPLALLTETDSAYKIKVAKIFAKQQFGKFGKWWSED